MSGEVTKKYGNPAQPDAAYKETLREGAHPNRSAEEPHEAPKGRVNKSKARGPHGSSTSSDGTPYLSPLKKVKTSGGDGTSK